MSLLDYLQWTPWTWYLLAILFGLVVGSFFNVAIYRLPLMLHCLWHQEATEFLKQHPTPPDVPKPFNLFFPRSRCPKCQTQLKAWQNIPVISFILSLGRCANCKQPIAWQYPLVELLTAALASMVVVHYGWQWQVWPALIFSGYLIVLSVIDMQHQYLLDELTLALLWLGLLFNLNGFYTSLESAVIGAIAGYVALWLVAKVFYLVTRREGIAYGDFKLLAALGAWLGWQSLPLVLIMACGVGIVTAVTQHLLKRRDLKQPIPFGPYLALGGWLFLLYGDRWFSNYVSIRF